ncbi:fumarylacetoacetate hydrolase family protein [Microbispora sp. NPDC046933]|uniref:fumarylacetoacetate hydrolase family protein n=1 Tax=Microbispora sp. NPDC046933 TaxID=3155618 RepID=UPI0033EFF50E
MPDVLPVHAGPFALGTFSLAQSEPFAGLVAGDRVRRLDVPGVTESLRAWDLDELGGLATGPGPWIPLGELEIHAPLRPRQVLQSGANYHKHVLDLVMAEFRADNEGMTEEEARAAGKAMMDARVANGTPYVFAGLPSAICGPYDDVVLPDRGSRHDWELELAVVIGRPAWRVPREEAMRHVAGYTICNDITTRDQLYRPDLKKIGTDWLSAKNAPTFLPTGPFLVPAAFAGDPMDLRIRLRHNGVVRQDESTKDMIFDIAELIAYTSARVPLSPGDLLLTGSPAGNGAHWGVFLKPGDVMDAEITGLGHMRNTCVAAD